MRRATQPGPSTCPLHSQTHLVACCSIPNSGGLSSLFSRVTNPSSAVVNRADGRKQLRRSLRRQDTQLSRISAAVLAGYAIQAVSYWSLGGSTVACRFLPKSMMPTPMPVSSRGPACDGTNRERSWNNVNRAERCDGNRPIIAWGRCAGDADAGNPVIGAGCLENSPQRKQGN